MNNESNSLHRINVFWGQTMLKKAKLFSWIVVAVAIPFVFLLYGIAFIK